MGKRIRYQRTLSVIVDDRLMGTIYCPTKFGQEHCLYSNATGLLLWRASTLTAMKRFISANWRKS